MMMNILVVCGIMMLTVGYCATALGLFFQQIMSYFSVSRIGGRGRGRERGGGEEVIYLAVSLHLSQILHGIT